MLLKCKSKVFQTSYQDCHGPGKRLGFDLFVFQTGKRREFAKNYCWLVSQLIDLFWLRVDFSKRCWGKNRDFMLMRSVNPSILIGGGGDS